MRLATGRYQDGRLIVKSKLAAVAVSRSLPKFPLAGYTIAAHLLELAPTWPQMHMEADKFEASYLRHLERLGIQHVMKRLVGVAEKAGTEGVVLCCFEPAGEPCHRRMLAGWIEEKTGLVVPELGSADQQQVIEGLAGR